MNTLKQKLEYLGETKHLIRNAIVEKGGNIADERFRTYADAIKAIPSGGSAVLEERIEQGQIRENGQRTFLPGEGYDGLSSVTIDINVPSEVKNQTKKYTITTNGHQEIIPDPLQGYTGMDRVILDVNVPTSGEVQPHNTIVISPDSADGHYGQYKGKLDPNADWTNCTMVSNLAPNISIDMREFPEMPNLIVLMHVFDNVYGVGTNPNNPDDPENGTFIFGDFPKLRNAYKIFDNCHGLKKIEFKTTSLPALESIGNFVTNSYDDFQELVLPDLPVCRAMEKVTMANRQMTKFQTGATPMLETLREPFRECGRLTDVVFDDLSHCKELIDIFDTHMSGGYQETIPNDGFNITNLSIKALPKCSLADWGLHKQNQLTVESLVNVINALPQLDPEQHFDCRLGTTNLGKLSQEQKQVATDKGWNLTE